MRHLLCIGLGYTAAALALHLPVAGWRITGSSRTEAGVLAIEALGYSAFVLDARTLADALSEATHLLISLPPDEAGDPLLRLLDDLRARKRDVAPSLRWIGYLSTIGVYGDRAGGWVDETTPAAPSNERSRRRLEAERQWLALAASLGLQAQIFRLAGIYGPGRSVVDDLRAGKARRIIKAGQVFNRIHVDDIAQVLAAAMTGRGRHQIYNLADDEPAPPQDVVAFAAGLIGVEPPPEIAFEDARLSAMAASFYGESKRVRNARMKSDLGVELLHPTYREGLRALVR